MKKQNFLLFSSLLALTACEPLAPPPAASAPQASQTALAPAISASAPVAAELAAFVQMTAAMQSKLAQASPEEANRLLQAHRAQLAPVLQKLNEQQQDFLASNYFDETNWQEMASAPRQAVGELKQKMDALASVQLRYADLGEGMIEIKEATDYYVNLFANKVSPDVANYLKLEAQQAKLSSTGELQPEAWDALGQQIYEWEKYIQTSPNSPYLADAKKYFNQTLELFLFGTEHEPIEWSNDPQLPDIAQEFAQIEQSWTDYAQSHPESQVVAMLKPASQIARLPQQKHQAREPEIEKFKKVYFKQ